MNKKTVFLVEDDSAIQKLIAQVLKKEGYNVIKTKSLASARKELKKNSADIFVIDRRLPDGDGLNLCEDIKSLDRPVLAPIMFLTSKNSTSDKVVGLKMGGDDYLTKPFKIDELLARIEALLRRTSVSYKKEPECFEFCGIVLDTEKHACTVDKKEIKLWPKEFELLKLFISKPAKVISKEFISQKIWGHEFIDTSRAIEMSIRRLRNKLGQKGELLETVKGYGFCLRKR